MSKFTVLLRVVACFMLSGFFPDSSNSQAPRTGAELEGLTFGHTQLFKSTDSVWLFLDVDEVSPSSGSEGALIKQRGFAAIEILDSCAPRIWRSDEDELTAHANFTSFVESGGSIYAVRQDRKLAWKLTPNNSGDQDAQRVVGSVVKVDYQGLTFVGDLERAQSVSTLKLVDTGKYGYGQFPPETYETRNTSVEFESRQGMLGWQQIKVKIAADGPRSSCKYEIDVEDLLKGKQGKAAPAPTLAK